MNSDLHIVSFDLPYPPGYGGIIDIYYKIRFLSEAGISVHLHYFRYGRSQSEDETGRAELEKHCAAVHGYDRMTGLQSAFSPEPYIVYSRRSEELVRNLCADRHPILFEGMHCCHYLGDPRLKGRLLIYRESNIEHEYYRQLASTERSFLKKIYFLIESRKLKRFQTRLASASRMLAVSSTDCEYLRQEFPDKEVLFIPSFHRDAEVHSVPGKGDFVLYQGNLHVPENFAAAEFLIRNVWQAGMPPLVIAGRNPDSRLLKLASLRENIRIVPNPGDEELSELLRTAHINLLMTFRPAGLKLKLLNALYNGRFCLVNGAMISGTTLGPLCELAESPEEFREKVRALFHVSFGEEEIISRSKILKEHYSNEGNGKRLLGAIRE